MTTHTPGPWSATERVPGQAYSWAVGSDDSEDMFALVLGAPRAAEANARLIAAAPDLLDALTDVLPYVGDAVPRIAFERAQAAIRKATGQ